MDFKLTPKSQNFYHVGTQQKTILRTEKLVKIYGKRRVVDGVSFDVGEGEVVGLLGSNGAGKTTSFRMSCGLIPANSGRIILNGLDVTRWPMYRRAREGRLGYLPQDRSTFGALTTEQNLYAAMEFLGYSRKDQKKECERLLKQFDLAKVRKTHVGYGGTGGLSGGERRRLEVARALLSKPKILLLDEPFANVDPKTVKEIQDVIRFLSNEGVAVLITDHQVDDRDHKSKLYYQFGKGPLLRQAAGGVAKSGRDRELFRRQGESESRTRQAAIGNRRRSPRPAQSARERSRRQRRIPPACARADPSRDASFHPILAHAPRRKNARRARPARTPARLLATLRKELRRVLGIRRKISPKTHRHSSGSKARQVTSDQTPLASLRTQAANPGTRTIKAPIPPRLTVAWN